ncbi:MAG TPA: globin family protein [Candidatus Limnocylindrales bacterium]
MTPEQRRLVQSSWVQVLPKSETAAALFYSRLFELEPAAARLFRRDMREQGVLFMQMISVIVRGLDDLATLTPAVEALGRRHVGYGVESADHDAVGAAFLWALQRTLGEGFSPSVQVAWASTYKVVASIMRQAAAGGTAPTGAGSPA